MTPAFETLPLLDQLAAIYAMPLGELLLISVVALALSTLRLFRMVRELRRDLNYCARVSRKRFAVMRGGKA